MIDMSHRHGWCNDSFVWEPIVENGVSFEWCTFSIEEAAIEGPHNDNGSAEGGRNPARRLVAAG